MFQTPLYPPSISLEGEDGTWGFTRSLPKFVVMIESSSLFSVDGSTLSVAL